MESMEKVKRDGEWRVVGDGTELGVVKGVDNGAVSGGRLWRNVEIHRVIENGGQKWMIVADGGFS